MKQNHFICDIETAPNVTEEQFDSSEVKVGNLKDPDKIKAKFAEARANFVSNAALSYWTGRICAIGYHYGDEGHVIKYAHNDLQEAEILEDFWERLGLNKVVGVNFKGFDLPFLVMRSHYHEVPNRMAWTERYDIMDKKVVDLMDIVNCFKYGEFTSLEKTANYFGVRSKLRTAECKSEEFWRYMASSDPVEQSKAENHLIADLEETLAIALKTKTV